LRERYSEEHPDLVRIKSKLAELTPIANDKLSGSAIDMRQPPQADNPVYITLRGQIASTQAEIASIRGRQNQLRLRLAEYDRRLRETPQAEREYMDITRERENATRRYQEVKAKLMEAQVAQSLEKDRKAEQFTVIEPPNLPEKPVRPNRTALALLGAALSLGVGMAIGGVREAMDKTIHSASQLAAASRTPVLASIPDFGASAARGRKISVRQALAALLAIAILVGLVHIFIAPIGSFLPTLAHKVSLRGATWTA